MTERGLSLGVLGHEIRTPLASIKSNLDVVISGDAGSLNPDQQHFLNRIAHNLKRLAGLVDDLLDEARRGSKPPLVKLQMVDLGPVLKMAVGMHEEAFARAGLQWDDQGVPPSFQVSADVGKVTQILDNLLSNAIKYCRRGDSVRIRLQTRPGDQSYCLEVEDSGPGMDQQTLKRAFDPFYRGQAANEAQVLGAGLGLHITRQLVQALGGRIRLDSTLGQGTRAMVFLPRHGRVPGGFDRSVWRPK